MLVGAQSSRETGRRHSERLSLVPDCAVGTWRKVRWSELTRVFTARNTGGSQAGAEIIGRGVQRAKATGTYSELCCKLPRAHHGAADKRARAGQAHSPCAACTQRELAHTEGSSIAHDRRGGQMGSKRTENKGLTISGTAAHHVVLRRVSRAGELEAITIEERFLAGV